MTSQWIVDIVGDGYIFPLEAEVPRTVKLENNQSAKSLQPQELGPHEGRISQGRLIVLQLDCSGNLSLQREDIPIPDYVDYPLGRLDDIPVEQPVVPTPQTAGDRQLSGEALTLVFREVLQAISHLALCLPQAESSG